MHLLNNYPAVYYNRGDGPPPFSWTDKALALYVPSPDLESYDLHGIASDESGSPLYLVASESNDFYTMPHYSCRIWVTRSLDRGATWQVPQQLGSNYGKGSSIAVTPDGTVCVSWVDYALGQVLVSRSSDHGQTYSAPTAAATMLDNLAMHPFGWRHAGTVAGAREYPYFQSSDLAANFPALAVDRSPGPMRGTLYMVWAEYPSGAPAAAAQTLSEQEPNDDFTTAQPVNLDSDIFGSLGSLDNADVDTYVFALTKGETVWIGGRGFAHTCGWEMWMELSDGSLRLIENQSLKSPLEADTWGQPKPTIFTAPRTGRYFVRTFSSALGFTGYQLSLRHYLAAPGSVSQDQRDIVLVRSTDGGQTWSPKLRVNHDPAGADQAMPNVAVDGQGRVYVAWYDWRNAADGDGVSAYASVSGDGGLTFGPDLRLSSETSNWIGPENQEFFLSPGELVGDRIAIAAGDGYGVVAWADFRDWPTSSGVYAARIADVPTATEAVSDFSAAPEADGVRLSWLVNDARAVSALRVYRSSEGASEVAVGDAAVHAGRLDYLDASVDGGHSYSYRLQVGGASGVRWLGPVTVQTPPSITALAWRTAWPNPFAKRTSVKLAVPRSALGSVRVYDLQGKEVRTLAEGMFEPGERSLEWDGRDAAGGMAAAGIYFLSAQVGGESARLRVARVP